jgi:hypothetical protein
MPGKGNNLDMDGMVEIMIGENGDYSDLDATPET